MSAPLAPLPWFAAARREVWREEIALELHDVLRREARRAGLGRAEALVAMYLACVEES